MIDGSCAGLALESSINCEQMGSPSTPPLADEEVAEEVPEGVVPPGGGPGPHRRLSEGGGGDGLQCHFTGGDGGRSLTIKYMCADEMDTTIGTDNPAGSVTYTLTLKGPAGCAKAPAPKPQGAKGLSGGSLFLILFFVFSSVYFAAGAGYNYKYNDMRGREMLPQWVYWKQLPGLVKDGGKFSYQQSQRFYAWANNKEPPVDPDLSKGLRETPPVEEA